MYISHRGFTKYQSHTILYSQHNMMKWEQLRDHAAETERKRKAGEYRINPQKIIPLTRKAGKSTEGR